MLPILFMLFAAAAAEQCNQACTMNYVPVCGTDGQTYGNVCEMQSTSCLQKTNIAVAYSGVCVENKCNQACTMKNEPVCGTDGQTYGNLCQMQSSSCLKNSNVAVAYAGECVAQPACNIACTMEYRPVCGTDSRTYGNSCELESVACMKKSNLRAAHEGACSDLVPAPRACNEACLMNFVPVCGTDGITYGNACQLESFACTKNVNVQIAYNGACSDLVPAPRACNEACLMNFVPVCGTDGITYGNACQLESFACTKNVNVQLAHNGAC